MRMGCLFIIGLVVLGFLLNLCGTNEDRSGTRETPTAASEDEPRKRQDAEQRQREEEEQRQREQEEAEAARAAIGETVRVGDAEWTVTNAIVASELTSDFMEPKAGNFVIVDFTFTNRANEAVTLTDVSLPLRDSQGREYNPDTDTFGYIDPGRDILLTQVNPGVTQQGQLIYSVAPDASGFVLHAGDLAVFSDETALIELGF